MKRVVIFIVALCGGIGFADAAVRSASNSSQSSRGAPTATTATSRGSQSNTQSATRGTATSRSRTNTSTTSRVATTQQSSRGISSRGTTGTSVTSRNAANTKTVSRAASRARTATNPAATTSRTAVKSGTQSRLSRAALMTAAAAGSNTFGSGYNACRDAYFTCMDQFCATVNDTYRRCICSSRLDDIRERERTLSGASNQLQDFKDLNLEVINKTGAEVKAMLSATAGESAIKKDTSDSAKTLANIGDVLSSTKTKALSTQGTLDIAGDINAVWATTDLASGTNLANLEGETLYNAVHSQCVDLISKNCPGAATLNMVVSAYGMYIENDCTTLNNAIDKKYNAAKTAVRETQSQMHDARLENYDAHNSASINDCIAQVRKDITADTACGTDYVHCMDITGKYLNRETGAAIYTPQFFEIEQSVSLAGDVLTNQTNRMLVAELNNKKVFAKRALNTCTDLADEVWDEFMRQAITEIYQGQRNRVRQVKDECLDVVNKCYDTTSSQLRDFSNQKDQLLIGARLELSEEMCKTKLDACANLYGGGSDGMTELVRTMHEITDQQIAKECKATLLDYTKDLCRVTGLTTQYQYPWGCRTYVPGTQQYALINQCNLTAADKENTDEIDNVYLGKGKDSFDVPDKLKSAINFTSCSRGYYLSFLTNAEYCDLTKNDNCWCKPCPDNKWCPGGTNEPQNIESAAGAETPEGCGDYIGSLYHRLVRYAMQACVRPTESADPLPTRILTDVNSVMDTMRTSIGSALAAECDRMGGEWHNEPNAKGITSTKLADKCRASGGAWNTHIVSNATIDKDPGECICPKPLFLNNDGECEYKLLDKFYTDTGANIQWGVCATSDQTLIDNEHTVAKNQVYKERCEKEGGTWSNGSCDCSTIKGVTNAAGDTVTLTWSVTNKQCVCPDKNPHWIDSERKCISCFTGDQVYDWSNKACKKCAGTTPLFNKVNNTCVATCPDGTTKNGTICESK